MGKGRGLVRLLQSAHARGHDMYEDPCLAARLMRFTCSRCGGLLLIAKSMVGGSAIEKQCKSDAN